MYILPVLTHLEVVALGDRSDISPDQHLFELCIELLAGTADVNSRVQVPSPPYPVGVSRSNPAKNSAVGRWIQRANP